MTQNSKKDNAPPYYTGQDLSPPPNFKGILTVVFLQPALVPVFTQCSWKKALKRVLLTAFVCGVLMGIVQSLRLKDDVTGWSEWFGSQIEEVWVDNGQLQWQPAKELPYSAYYKDWRVDFAKGDTSVPSAEKLGPGRKGVWISTSNVVAWWRIAGDRSKTRTMLLYNKDGILSMFDPSRLIPTEGRLRGREIQQVVGKQYSTFIPFFCVLKGITTVMQMMFYILVFASIPYLLRSPIATGGFGSVLAFYLYAALPALFIATVYRLLNVPFLDFAAIFAGAFVGYLLLVMWYISRKMKKA